MSKVPPLHNLTVRKMRAQIKSGSDEVSPVFVTVTHWTKVSGMSRSKTYQEIGRGNLRSVKCGRRTLLDMQAGLDWMRSLPPATVRAPSTKSCD